MRGYGRTGLRTRTARLVILLGAAVLAIGAATALPAEAGPPSPAASTPSAHYAPAGCNRELAQQSGKALHARCFATVWTANTDGQITANVEQPPPGALGPADIQDAYHLPAAGQGQTVAIVDAFGDSNAEADLAVFRSQFGLPTCTTANGCLRIVDQRGGTNLPADDSGWALETSLDLDAVSAACPACNVLLVQADDNSLDNLGAAVETAVGLGPVAVSNSYGVPGEDPAETSFDHFYDHKGVAITASSGDTGNVTNWPATNPTVTAVGGTHLTRDTSDPRGWKETAWSDAGSGCSPFEPHPGYQNGYPTACDNRAIADVSAVADPATGLAVYDTLGQGGWLQVGGTSLSSPSSPPAMRSRAPRSTTPIPWPTPTTT